MITARVSHIAAFKRWKEDEESSVDWLINSILSNEETEAMAKGTAFHKFMEHAVTGQEIDHCTVDGYTFYFTGDFQVYLPPMRELRRNKDYGGIIVSGQCDGLIGKTIIDHKSTERFDAEKYLTGAQWMFYLDIFEADRFIWNVWEMKHLGETTSIQDALEAEESVGGVVGSSQSYEVRALHQLEQFRYPALGEDCRDLALEYRAFALRYMPQLDKEVAA